MIRSVIACTIPDAQLLLHTSNYHCTTFVCDAENVCEGFDHPEAPPTDVRDAARQLKLATIQEYQKRLAYKPSKKQQRAAVAATAVDVEQPSSRSRVAVDINQGTNEVQDGTSSSGTGDSTSSSVPSWQNRLQRLQQLTHESS